MKKILIAEDILRAANKERGLLRRSDIEVLRAGSNREALDIHKEEKADLIVVHLDAGELTGEELCSIIRDDEELRDVSIIVASPEGPGDERSGRCRANSIIKTPLSSPELFERASRLLDIPSRATIRVPMGVKVQGAQANSPFVGFAENISATGMLFESEKVLWKGLRLFCSFFLPGDTQVKTEAEVVRVSTGKTEYDILQYGVRFRGLEEDLRAAIEEYVKEICPKE